jgi:hypothetical protein
MSETKKNSVIYKIKCLDFPLKYVVQAGRIFRVRFKEHIHAFRSYNINSRYSNHILNTGHVNGAMTEIMDVIRTEGKTDTLEPGSGHVGFVLENVALGQVFSEYFGFPCQSSFHQLLHNHHHPSSMTGTIGQTVATVPSGLSLAP